MEYVFGWLILCCLVGALASSRGRSFIGWSALAFVISPFISGIIVLCIANVAEQDKAEAERRRQYTQKANRDAQVMGADMVISFDKLRQLKDKNIVSEIEFGARKQKILHDLKSRMLSESPEAFLGAFIPLIENGTLRQDEVDQIKAFAFSEKANVNAAEADPGIC